MADKGMLARLLAGLITPKAPNFAPTSPNPFNVPFTGLRNEPAPGLPPFQPPGTQAAAMMPPMQLPSGPMQPGAEPVPSAAPMPAPQMQPPAWMALGNQARTAAFDPQRDAMDPGNVHVVDQSGAVNPMMGPPSQSDMDRIAQQQALLQLAQARLR